MDIYDRVLETLLSFSIVQNWSEMRTVLLRAITPRPSCWQLPVLACEAAGGRADLAIPAVAAIACLQTSLLLIDDLLDADPRGQHHQFGIPAITNLASAFQALGLDVIELTEGKPEVKLAMIVSLNRMLHVTALGQYLDTQNPANESAYWRVVQTKSSPFFGTAFQIGALAGGASIKTAEQLKQLGNLYGEMIQIHDDLNDTMATPAGPDWISGRSTLPILFARIADHPDRQRFLELSKDVSRAERLEEAQTILIQCGSVSYCFDQIIYRYKQAYELLGMIPIKNYSKLKHLLDALVDPISELFKKLGVDFPIADLTFPQSER